MRLLFFPFSGFSFFHIIRVKQIFLLAILSICLISLYCSKNKKTPLGPDYGIVYPVICDAPAWSPDGSTIVYHYNGITEVRPNGGATADPSLYGLWFVRPDGTNKSMFLQGGDLPDWSPDGQKIVFEAGAQIYTIRINGDSLTQLTYVGRNFFPDWSPDGKKIAYDTSIPVDSAGIWIINISNSYARHLGLGYMPDWSPDGSRLTYSGLGSEIYTADTNGNNEIKLTSLGQDTRYPAFSPDGKKIAYSNQKPGEVPQIWVMDSRGNNLIKLTTEGGYMPTWSPDGTKIAYVSYNLKEYSSKQGQIWIMDVDGNNKRQLTFDGW